MRIRMTLLAALLLLAGCSASPSASDVDGASYQSQYVGPGSTGDQSP
jgi:hypothetical protein